MSAPASTTVASSSLSASLPLCSASSTILYRQVSSAHTIDVHNAVNHREKVVGIASCAILAEAIRLRKLIEKPSAEVQQQITQLQHVHDRFLVQIDADTWNILRDPAFLIVGSGLTQDNYDCVIVATIQKHNLRVPPITVEPKLKLHPGCQCVSGCECSEAQRYQHPDLRTEEGVHTHLNYLFSQPAAPQSHSLNTQLAGAYSLTDVAGLPRATLVLLEEAIQKLMHEIAELKEAHRRFSDPRTHPTEAWGALNAPEWRSAQSTLSREDHDRVVGEAIRKFQLELPPQIAPNLGEGSADDYEYREQDG